MATIRMTMAQALLCFWISNTSLQMVRKSNLSEALWGIFGHGNVTGIGEALENHPGELAFIQGKNEQGMAHAAAAFAKQRNRRQIFACTSSIGPGALNMVTAAGTATVNRIPSCCCRATILPAASRIRCCSSSKRPNDYTVSATMLSSR